MRRLVLLSLLLSGTAIAQDKPDISVETLKTVTQVLSSDEYEGRAPTTPAEDKTVATSSSAFKRPG
ncbi:Uncharacterised protein [Sphingomonas paucimobilis]|nr:Uncharacterised protein [Sphingomonas paucimobilis]